MFCLHTPDNACNGHNGLKNKRHRALLAEIQGSFAEMYGSFSENIRLFFANVGLMCFVGTHQTVFVTVATIRRIRNIGLFWQRYRALLQKYMALLAKLYGSFSQV